MIWTWEAVVDGRGDGGKTRQTGKKRGGEGVAARTQVTQQGEEEKRKEAVRQE